MGAEDVSGSNWRFMICDFRLQTGPPSPSPARRRWWFDTIDYGGRASGGATPGINCRSPRVTGDREFKAVEGKVKIDRL